MSRSYSPLAFIGAVLLLIFGLTLFPGADQAFSDTSNVAPKKQFVLPPKNKTGLTRSQMRGKAIFDYYCATCHGNTGNADGFNAYSLTPRPPKLSNAKFMATLSDATIKKAIKEGGASLGLSPHMPPWGGVLNNRNISDVMHFIQTLVK